MHKMPHHRLPTRAQHIANQAVNTVERLLHIEAISGIALIVAAAIALIWANSPYGDAFINFWNTEFGFSFGDLSFSWSLHFWVNNVLITLFFLGTGMEIRRELHEGVLSNLKQAILPVVGALGGLIIPAAIYIYFNLGTAHLYGWIVPTTTGVAFAVGVLSLLGTNIPTNIRIILLSIAIIDCIIAVFIIAIFYSDTIQIDGVFICAFAIILIVLMQWIGIANAWFYGIPGIILWWGFYQTGIQPSFAGALLGMMTPVIPETSHDAPLKRLQKATAILDQYSKGVAINYKEINLALKEIRISQRKFLPPVTRIQLMIHPWSAYIVMPLFAFANSGVALKGLELGEAGTIMIMIGIILSLCIGKPIGVLTASYIAVKAGLCQLPPKTNWVGMLLIGTLSGIGFTTAVFISILVFKTPNILASSKIAILIGSCISMCFSFIIGYYYKKQVHKI